MAFLLIPHPSSPPRTKINLPDARFYHAIADQSILAKIELGLDLKPLTQFSHNRCTSFVVLIYPLPFLLSCLTIFPVELPPSTLVAQETVTTSAQAPYRLRFSKQKRMAVVEGSVVRGDRDVFVLKAKRGQKMSINISALEDNAVFELRSPTGKILQEEGSKWYGVIKTTGDYQILVGGVWGNATYRMEVMVK